MTKLSSKLSKVCEEVFSRMYEEADPPARYPRNVKSYEDHYLSMDRQQQVFREVLAENGITDPDEKRALRKAVFLGNSPSTIKPTKR